MRAAWSEALKTLLDAGAANLYALLPPAAALAAADRTGIGFALAQKARHCCDDPTAASLGLQ